MPVVVRVKRKQVGTAKAGRNDRSLGFMPLVIMTVIYLICTVFADEIGTITSAPGFYRLNRPPPNRGCVLQHAT